MGLADSIASAVRGDSFRAGTPGPANDYWYTPRGVESAAFGRITPDQARRLAAVSACVRYISFTMASLPLKIYRRLPKGGKEEATNHPINDLFRTQPNDWQTWFQFRQQMWDHIELRGNFYARIVPGPRGAVDQLWPLNPDMVSVEQLPSGQVQYVIGAGGRTERLLKDEVFHLFGMSENGLTGLSTISAWADVIGLGLGMQDYAGRFVRNDARPSGFIETDQVLKPEAKEKLGKEWQAGFTEQNRGKTAILEAGLKYNSVSISNKDAQFVEARKMSWSEIASLFGIPPHKIGWLEKSAFSNIEEQNIDVVVDAVRPRAVLLEQAISRDLLIAPDRFFPEHNLDGLLRGNIKSRYEAYSIGITQGFLTRNEVRNKENLNPIDGLDEPVVQMNMVPASAKDSREAFHTAQSAIVTSRKEVKAMRGGAERDEFVAFLDEYYAGMSSRLVSKLGLSPEAAQKYVGDRRAALVDAQQNGTVGDLLNQWEKEDGQSLAALALEGRHEDAPASS